jgi:hypothetical protein
MRAYPTEVSEDHYYFKDGKLLAEHAPGSVGIIAPGEVVWKSDLDSLRAIRQGKEAAVSLESVAAKYLINYAQED